MSRLDDLFARYIDKFGDGFPSYQLLRGKTEEESCEIVQRCIDAERDAYELGLCAEEAIY